MRAALVIYGPLSTLSGGYLYDRMLVERLQRAGDDVQIISQSRRGLPAAVLDNLEYAPPDADLVLQDELNHASLFLANRAHRRAPIVAIVHHLSSMERGSWWRIATRRWIERRFLQSVDAFVFNSETTRAAVQELVGSHAPFVVATPGGDRLGSLRAEDVRKRLAASTTLRLVSLGSIVPGKGLDVLLEALARLGSEDVRLDVIGSTAADPSFAARMRRKGESCNLPVVFSGALDDDEVSSRLARSDAMVLPSFYEGFGIAVLEGMAHGLPAIGCDSGATPTLIGDGHNGFLIPPNGVAQLANRISQLCQDRQLLGQLSAHALETYQDFPTWDQSMARIADFLHSIAPPA